MDSDALDQPVALKGVDEIAVRMSRALLEPDIDTAGPSSQCADLWTRFARKAPPAIPLPAYITRLLSYLKPDPRVLSAVLIYKHRLSREEGVIVDELSVHRFLLTAIVAASKAMLDDYYAMSYYGRVGGVGARELAGLEMALCRLLKWRLFCSAQEIEDMNRQSILTLEDKASGSVDKTVEIG